MKLEDGIIAIGSRDAILASNYSIRLANHLAEKEKVLFITFLSYKEKIQQELLETN